MADGADPDRDCKSSCSLPFPLGRPVRCFAFELMIGQPVRSPLRAVLTHILCRSCHRKTPFWLSQATRPHRGCFAVLLALIRSLPLDSPLRAERSFSLPKPFPRLCVRQSLICYGSLPRLSPEAWLTPLPPGSCAALRVPHARDLPRRFCTRLLCLGLSRGPRPSDCLNGTLLPQSSGVPSGSLLWRASPHLLPEAWFAGFIVHPCTRCSQGSPFGSTFGGYNSTFPRSRFSGLVPPSAFSFQLSAFSLPPFFILHSSLCLSAFHPSSLTALLAMMTF